MNLFKIDNSKVTFTKTQFGSTNFLMTGIRLQFRDDNYYIQMKEIFKNYINNNFELLFIKNNTTFCAQVIRIQNFNAINGVMPSARSDFYVDFLIRDSLDSVGEPSDFQIYIKY